MDLALSLGPRIDALRDEIVDAALFRSLSPERRSVAADILANSTLDSLIEWVEGAPDEHLVSEVRIRLEAASLNPAYFHLPASTVSATLDVLSLRTPLPAHTRRRLSFLHQQIEVCASACDARRRARTSHAVDAIDAKIEDLIYGLASVDTLTAEHSRSVAMWCSRIAKRLSFTREETMTSTRSGLLHDVGKAKTPLHILTAPRGLTDEEWVIMKMHAVEGATIVEAIPELRSLSGFVRSHHERYDGRGYPDGVSAIDIPLHARVISVADAFNAMIARRPYRLPLSPSEAIEELKRNSGTQFDRVIVEAMIDVVLQSS
jgi:putative nucleotidyltransferase with HDIG domain